MDGFCEMKQAMLVVALRGVLHRGDDCVAPLRLGDYLLEIPIQTRRIPVIGHSRVATVADGRMPAPRSGEVFLPGATP